MAEIIKDGDLEKAKVGFRCPACGTEFTELPGRLELREITKLRGSNCIMEIGYEFGTKCPLCGIQLIKCMMF